MAVYDVGLRAFRETITRHDHVRDRLRCVLLENVRIERAGRLIDQTGMRCALYMLADLGIESSSVYEEDFECFFLEETRSRASGVKCQCVTLVIHCSCSGSIGTNRAHFSQPIHAPTTSKK